MRYALFPVLSVMAVAAGATAAAADDSWIYRPTEALTYTADGLPAARYVVPREAPAGDVTITTQGQNGG